MTEYREQITLNEQDSLMDLLNLEKDLVKLYALLITEGVSKGFRESIISNLSTAIDDQFLVFTFLTELDYYRVTSEEKEKLIELKEQFNKVKQSLK